LLLLLLLLLLLSSWRLLLRLLLLLLGDAGRQLLQGLLEGRGMQLARLLLQGWYAACHHTRCTSHTCGDTRRPCCCLLPCGPHLHLLPMQHQLLLQPLPGRLAPLARGGRPGRQVALRLPGAGCVVRHTPQLRRPAEHQLQHHLGGLCWRDGGFWLAAGCC
jgi:hypothetical protein